MERTTVENSEHDHPRWQTTAPKTWIICKKSVKRNGNPIRLHILPFSYYYLHNSIKKHPNGRLVWPNPQNRKSSLRTAHFMVEASLLPSHHSLHALFFFVPSLPTTQRGLCRGESCIVVTRRVACKEQTSFQSLLLSLCYFFRRRALFFLGVLNIVLNIKPPIKPVKVWESSE